jgi:hypothetical protein
MSEQPAALFVRERGGYRPTRLSGSPWSPDALHGGPAAALLAWAVDWIRVKFPLVEGEPLSPLAASGWRRAD